MASEFLPGVPSPGNEKAVRAQHRARWRSVFPILKSAREGLARTEAEQEAAETECR